jgi:hypothetical protein
MDHRVTPKLFAEQDLKRNVWVFVGDPTEREIGASGGNAGGKLPSFRCFSACWEKMVYVFGNCIGVDFQKLLQIVDAN